MTSDKRPYSNWPGVARAGKDSAEDVAIGLAGRTSLWSPALLRMASVLFGLVMALVVAEIGLRVFYTPPVIDLVFHAKYQLSDNPTLGYELKPGSRDLGLSISSAGLRDREFSISKPSSVFRIAVVGDSVTFGLHMPRSKAYPKKLENLLNKDASVDKRRYEVMNFGVTGYNATQIAEAVASRVLRYQPDLIIYGYVLNDPQEYSLEADALEQLARRAEQDAADGVPGWPTFLPESRLALFLYASLVVEESGKMPLYFPEPGYSAYAEGRQVEYLRGIHNDPASWDVVRSGLVKIASVTQQPRPVPVLVAIVPIEDPDGFASYPLGETHDKVAAEARRNGLYALDLALAFRAASDQDDTKLFRDFLHPYREGNEVIAQALLKWLCESEYLPPDGVCDLD